MSYFNEIDMMVRYNGYSLEEAIIEIKKQHNIDVVIESTEKSTETDDQGDES